MNRSARGVLPAEPLPQNRGDEIDLRMLLVTLRRNWQRLLLGFLLGLLLAVAQLSTTTRLYTSHVDIVIGRSVDADAFQDYSGVVSRAAEIQIETELQILTSEQIARRVVRRLSLHENARFMESQTTLLGEFLSVPRATVSTVLENAAALMSDGLPDAATLANADIDPEVLAFEEAVGKLRANIHATSERGSRVLRVRYTSASPRLSAQIANAVAESYIDDQLEAMDAASQRAVDWLRQRRDELRLQLEEVSRLVEAYREEHGLLGVDVDMLASAELERLSGDLIAARALVVELETRDRRLAEIVENEDTSAVVRETAGQGITSGLRSRYLEVLRNYNSLASTLGDSHEQTQRRQRELQEIETLMFEEVRRSARLLREDLRAARERVEGLEAAQARVGERVGADQAVIMQLRDLENNVETVRSLYTSFQQRHQEATQRQEIPVSNARVLNRAGVPNSPSSPNAILLLGMGGLLGLMFAGGWIGVREWRDDKVRSEEHVRTQLGLEHLGGLTVIRGRTKKVSPAATNATAHERDVAFPGILTYAAENPLSNFAEILRTGKMGLTLQNGQSQRAPKVGFVSCFPAEGKTTVAANFANLLAQQGENVVLIDADLRNPGLTRATGEHFDTGLVDVLLGEADWREIAYRVAETGVTLIPNGKRRIAHSAELLSSRGMRDLLEQLDQLYDYVILDLPPLGPVVDARAILDRLDGVFFVLKWGGTNLELARRILHMDPRLREKSCGAFLNFFDPKKARSYGDSSSYGHYRDYHGRYYRDG